MFQVIPLRGREEERVAGLLSLCIGCHKEGKKGKYRYGGVNKQRRQNLALLLCDKSSKKSPLFDTVVLC